MTDKKEDAEAPRLIFPATLAADAENGATHVRINIKERKDGKFVDVAILHLNYPIGFVVTDSGNYGSGDFGAGAAGFNAVMQGLGIRSGDSSKITQQDVLSQSDNISEILSAIPGVDIVNKGARIQALGQGVAQNPFTYVTYEGQQLRSFTMDFKMISESPEEAKTIRDIIDVVRKYSMPESTGTLSIQYPAFFEIEFYRGEDPNPFMPKIFQCHLTSLGTTYNATSNIFHADGAPLETDMSLSFQERKSLTRGDLYELEGDVGTDTADLVLKPEDIATEDNTTTVPPTE